MINELNGFFLLIGIKGNRYFNQSNIQKIAGNKETQENRYLFSLSLRSQCENWKIFLWSTLDWLMFQKHGLVDVFKHGWSTNPRFWNINHSLSHDQPSMFLENQSMFSWNINQSTAWKFHDFSALRFYVKSILQNLESSKTAFFAILGALNFVTLEDFSLQKVPKFIEIRIQILQMWFY